MSRPVAVTLDVADKTDTICVIGAGSSGLAAAKNLRENGYPVECLEREDSVGGNWNFGKPNSRVYASTHTISSKPFTQYPDFPMPDDFPDYPHHSQLLAYFTAYARHFGLAEVIRFGTEVVDVSPHAEGKAWNVTVRTDSGAVESARYGGVVIANGHNWNPKIPEYPGQESFSGQILHSCDYKDAAVLRDRKVLVVGAGNTGCDIAVEAAQNATHTWHSTRRGYWYAPKYMLGKPSDQLADLMLGMHLPLKVRQFMFKVGLLTTVGSLPRRGLPTPDHDIFETHPIVNSLLVYYVGQGDIAPRPDIARFEANTVSFTDGSTAAPDVVVFATGYLVRFDFIDPAHLNWQVDRPRLYQHVFSPRYDNLFMAGLIQPDSGQFTLAHWQSVAIAQYLQAQQRRPATAAGFRDVIWREINRVYSSGAHYKNSTRHYYEVAHMDYLRGLERTINLLEQP